MRDCGLHLNRVHVVLKCNFDRGRSGLTSWCFNQVSCRFRRNTFSHFAFLADNWLLCFLHFNALIPVFEPVVNLLLIFELKLYRIVLSAGLMDRLVSNVQHFLQILLFLLLAQQISQLLYFIIPLVKVMLHAQKYWSSRSRLVSVFRKSRRLILSFLNVSGMFVNFDIFFNFFDAFHTVIGLHFIFAHLVL